MLQKASHTKTTPLRRLLKQATLCLVLISFQYEPISAPVWAYFRELLGKEVFAAATTNYKEEVLFTVNFHPEITNTHVIRLGGVLYDITRVEPFEGYKEDITLYCCRRARQ